MRTTGAQQGPRSRRRIIIALALATVASITACSSAPHRGAAAFCTGYVDVARLGAGVANPDDVSIAALRAQVRALEHAAADAARKAPDDIAATVDEVIAPLQTLGKALETATTREATTRALRAYRVDATKVASSQHRLDTWVSAHCGVVPVTSTTPPVTVQPGVTG